ncbi:MAG: metallophosphoesterase, partial [Pseudomonadota bacterium]
GNHEYARLGGGEEQTDRILSILWRPQFTLPTDDSLPDDLQEVVYKVPYSKDLDIFILSTQNSNLEAQADWLDRELANSTARWQILSMHHPIFTSGRDRDSADRREALLPIIKKYNIDLVLQGHDHTYARGATGQTPERLGVSDEVGQLDTMFVNSVSGPKQYTFKETGWDEYAEDGVELIRKAENTPFFQIIEIDGNNLSYEARTATGQLYDRFEMTKTESGAKEVTRGSKSTMDERLFETTAPYTDANDLK